MSVLTSVVAAEEDEIEEIGASPRPVDTWSGIELRDLDTAKIATLHSLLTGDLFDDAAAYCEPVHVSDEGALVLRLADEAMARLAELDEEQLEQIAGELAATEEFEDAGWPDEEIATLLTALADLARIAESQGQALFVWIYPLET